MHWQYGPLLLRDPDETNALAHRIAPVLQQGDVVALSGPVGAGKSHFARAVLRALGVEEDIPSPTFTIVQSYDTAVLELWHCDLYRLGDDPQEIVELGLEEAALSAALLVEWPDALPNALLQTALHVTLGAGSDGHTVTLGTNEAGWQARLEPVLG